MSFNFFLCYTFSVIIIRKGVCVKLTIVSWRRPKINKIQEVIQGTLELRKIMGWNGNGCVIDSANSHEHNLMGHWARFDSREAATEMYEKMREKNQSEVQNKIKEINENCNGYFNSHFDVIENSEGVNWEDKPAAGTWVRIKAKPGKIHDLIENMKMYRSTIPDGNIKPGFMKNVNGDMSVVHMTRPMMSMNDIADYDQTLNQREDNKALTNAFFSYVEEIHRYNFPLIYD